VAQKCFFFPLWLHSPILGLCRFHETFRFISVTIGQSAGHIGRVMSSSQGLCVSAPGDYDDGEVGGMNGFGRENRSTRRKPARRHFVHHKFHLPDPGANPGRRGGKPTTNRFSYGAATRKCICTSKYRIFAQVFCWHIFGSTSKISGDDVYKAL
jgi:hypothetical protein